MEPRTSAVPAPAWGEIVFAGDAHRSTLSRAASGGTLRRIAPGIYTGVRFGPIEQVVRRRWLDILAHKLPGAILADRSARRTELPADGRVYVIHGRDRSLDLPGMRVMPRSGPGPLPGDIQLPHGVYLSSRARALLDNLSGRGARYLSRDETERWVGDILSSEGEAALNAVRDSARDLAQTTGQEKAFDALNRMIAAVLATGPADGVVSDLLRARAVGAPYDVGRLDAFVQLAARLTAVSPAPLPALPIDAQRRALLPFYEAYFSNYIEGTEFTLDEAAEIILEGKRPADRPADAHDILGTYELVADEREMRQRPTDAQGFIDLLRSRHATILGGRPEMRPGQFKLRPNRAGSTLFVEPDLVEGTLCRGYDAGRELIDPFARAVFMMFLVSEVHPFADGNGRVARVMMNAELVAGGEVRIIIPTVYRDNYVSALKGASHAAGFDPLIAALRFARQWTATIDFSDRGTAERDLARSNALRDPGEAEAAGIRLRIQ